MQQYQSQTIRSSGFSSTAALTDVEGAKLVARRIFQNYDKGQKGRLEGVDCVPMIVEAYKTCNQYYSPSSDDIRQYHKVLDRNGDGQVTYQDIEDLCIKYLCGSQQVQVQVQQSQGEKVKRSAKPQYSAEVERRLDVARRLFKKYDTDGSGFLNEQEVVGLIKDTYAEMGMRDYTPSSTDVKIWLQMGDTNKDGTVSLEEYEVLVIKSLEKAGFKVDQQKVVF